jgi:hypothetical protein
LISLGHTSQADPCLTPSMLHQQVAQGTISETITVTVQPSVDPFPLDEDEFPWEGAALKLWEDHPSFSACTAVCCCITASAVLMLPFEEVQRVTSFVASIIASNTDWLILSAAWRGAWKSEFMIIAVMKMMEKRKEKYIR